MTRDRREAGGPLVLALESSCDETAAALLDGPRRCVASVVSSQVDVHRRYGGVVPELASRAHILAIGDVVERALDEAGRTIEEVDAIAVTLGPGLVGSLLVAIEFAKGVAAVRDIPVVPVHHLEGHLLAPWLEVAEGSDPPGWPLVGLVVSGGHTSLFLARGPGDYEELGRTRDDAAGEAFDKVSKRLGLGYPGGPIIEQLARGGEPDAVSMPRPMLRKGGADFSFSGLKTAVRDHLRRAGELDEQGVADLAASFQEAVCDVLVKKTVRAARQRGVDRVLLTGGVACNGRLRERMAERARSAGLSFVVPPRRLCTDNAAMIGAAGYARAAARVAAGTGFAGGELNARGSWPLVG